MATPSFIVLFRIKYESVVRENGDICLFLFVPVWASFRYTSNEGARARVSAPVVVAPRRAHMSARASLAPRPPPPPPYRRRRPLASASDADAHEPSTSSSTAPRTHWSSKLRDARANTRDDLRLNARIRTGDVAGDVRVTDVLRDGDNARLTSAEALVTRFVRDELGLASDADAARRLERVATLVPGLLERGYGVTGGKTLVKWAADPTALAVRLRSLRETFPTCDVATLALKTPRLVFDEDHDELRQRLEALRELFPNAGRDGKPDVDRMVQACPQLLDVAFARAALEALSRAGVGFDTVADAAEAVHKWPALALKVESAHLRSSYSPNFDQAHVRANRVRAETSRAREAYYDVDADVPATRARDPEQPYW